MHDGAKRGVMIGLIRVPAGSRAWIWEMVALVAVMDASAELSR